MPRNHRLAAPLAATLTLIGCAPSFEVLVTRGQYTRACLRVLPDYPWRYNRADEVQRRVKLARLALHTADLAGTRLAVRVVTPAELEAALGFLPEPYRDGRSVVVAWHGPPVTQAPRETSLADFALDLPDGTRLHEAHWAADLDTTLRTFGVPPPPPRPVAVRRPSLLAGLVRGFFRLATLGLLPEIGDAFARIVEDVSALATDTVDRLTGLGRAVASVWKKDPPELARRRLAAARHLALLQRGTWTLGGLRYRFLLLTGQRPDRPGTPRPATLSVRVQVWQPFDGKEAPCLTPVRIVVPLPPGPTLGGQLAALFPRPLTLAEILARPGVRLVTDTGAHPVPRTPLLAPAR